jgi:hypothetical protein
MKSFSITKTAVIAAASLAMSVASSSAISFTTSEGTQPFNVGTITLTQVNANTVNVLVDLSSSQYGFMNTGGPHTPFTFTLAGSEAGVSATFIQPVSGIFSFGMLSLNLGGGANTPFGTYGVAIDSSAGNGSGKAYYGDLEFNLTRASGLLLTDFIANTDGYYFGADLTDGKNTGAQGWSTPSSVPDGGATLTLLGVALGSLGLVRRKLATT